MPFVTITISGGNCTVKQLQKIEEKIKDKVVEIAQAEWGGATTCKEWKWRELNVKDADGFFFTIVQKETCDAEDDAYEVNIAMRQLSP